MLKKINQEYEAGIAQAFTNSLHKDPRYLYITPSLAEVDRVTQACPSLDFRDPEPIEGRKYYHLDKLIEEGRNICTTHSLFKMLTRATYAKLREHGYTLVIDEVLNCVELFEELSKKDREHLFSNQMLTIEENTQRVLWNEDQFHDYSGRFNDIKELCRNGNLVLSRGAVLIWEFPLEFLKCFEQVYILTYLFHGSTMAAYLTAGNVYPQMMAVQDNKLVSWDEVDEASIKERLRSCITVYDGPGNRIGARKDKENPLSASWYKRADTRELEKLRASTEHFFKSIAGTPSQDNSWTTFKDFRKVLSGKGYTKGFLPNNLRATNDYIDKKSSAYLCNTFLHPYVRGHFTDRGIMVYEDLYALSEMLQWLWRGQVRRFDPITVFIPSERMRKLLMSWLESDTVEDLFQRVGYRLPLKMAA